MKMTPSQVKDEFKQREGDPLVKRKIRSKQFAFLQEAIRKNLDKADVIITNPTHFAVALSYAHGEMEVPKVVAKGVDHVARAIRKLARERTIPIVENRRLARSLYYQTGVDEPIPDEFFRPVAEILAFVYRLKGNPSGGKP
jgi:flagellar biosynthetic protein FlhB